MEKNYKLSIGDVVNITKDYCDLIDSGNYSVVYNGISLLDGDKLENYVTLFCCKSDDVKKAIEELDSFKGKKKEDYHFNNDYCHIATYKQCESEEYVSFDEKEECGIHAKYNKKYNCIEDFFIKYIRFRNDLIDKKIIVRDEGINKYFSELKKSFESIGQKTKQKKKRR